MKRLGFLQNDNGDLSMGRLIAFIGTILSGICVLVGCYLCIFGDAPKVQAGTTIIAAGVGLFASGALLKGWQARSEAGTKQGEP